MKVIFYKPVHLVLISIFCTFLLMTACQNNTKDLSGNAPNGNIPDNGYTDFDEAMQFEFNIIKNPTTGKIPEGSYEGEMAQARAILASQQQINGVTVNPYTFQGPDNLGGRTRTLAYDVRNGTTNSVIIAGGVSGGVYKSIDDGATWVRKSPTGQHFSCTSIAQDPRVGFQNTWYYGVGEATGNSTGATGAYYSGNGVYKSTDNGETWSRLAASNATALETFSTATDFVNKVIVDPTTGYVYIACPATILRSTDGGATWGTVLSGTLVNSSQFTDIVVTSTGRFYAGFGGTNSVGADGVWTSTTGDSGSWTRIAGPAGTPTGWSANAAYGRVVLGIAPSHEAIVYVLCWNGSTSSCAAPAPEAKFFKLDMTTPATPVWADRSANLPDEAGCLAGNDPFACQGGYDLVVAVKPDDENAVFIGGTNSYRSTDGFATTGATKRIGGYAIPATYSLYLNSHPDVHAFAFKPTSSTTMICCDDGGIQRTTDDLASTVVWTQINAGYRTYQYYYVDIDPRLGNGKAIGGAQDNGSTRNTGGSGTTFESVWGGDGVSVGLTDLIAGIQYEYVGSQSGFINRRDAASALGLASAITPTGEGGTGLFVTLYKLDPDNTERLYYANDNALYRTTSASTVTAATWTSMTGVAASVVAGNYISALATTRGTYSAAASSLFMGTSNGKVFRLDDPTGVAAATTPVNITGASFPAAAYVSSIAVNPRNDDTVLVTFSNYGVTSVWWTGTANSATPTWTAVEGALTLPSYRTSAIAITATGVDYFVGTSTGLYTATGLPGSTAWTQEGSSDIGNAVVTSLSLRPVDNKLLVGTHGYGMFYTNLSIPALPVTLTEFKGSLLNKHVLLQWRTSSEVNCKYFVVEKSYDGIHFRKIATIPAAGFSNTLKQYSFADEEKLSEKNYYRLRTVDIDDNGKLSNTILIKAPDVQQEMIVLGNPFKNNILIRFVKAPETAGELRLTDMSGRLMASQKIALGEQQIQFFTPAGKLSNGVYQLQAEINGNKFTRQVIKD